MGVLWVQFFWMPVKHPIASKSGIIFKKLSQGGIPVKFCEKGLFSTPDYFTFWPPLLSEPYKENKTKTSISMNFVKVGESRTHSENNEMLM